LLSLSDEAPSEGCGAITHGHSGEGRNDREARTKLIKNYLDTRIAFHRTHCIQATGRQLGGGFGSSIGGG